MTLVVVEAGRIEYMTYEIVAQMIQECLSTLYVALCRVKSDNKRKKDCLGGLCKPGFH